MKPNFIQAILLLIIFCSISEIVLAQKPKLCGPYKIDFPALQKAKKFEAENAHRIQAANYLVRVYFHICQDNNGSNAAATQAQIQTEFNTLVADYASDNICFINCGINYINNSKINNNLNPDVPSDVALLNPFLIPSCINIFYHASLGKYGGNAYSIPNTFCSVARGNIGMGHSISHEAGHCFGMLHTFETGVGGYEDIDGSNSSTAGDLIPDTPADPYAYFGQDCFSTTGCLYNGSCSDPNGDKNFLPSYINMMAYWWVYKCFPNLVFTADQFSRINSFLNSNSDLQNCGSPFNVTMTTSGISSGYFMQSAINAFTTNGSVTISGSANATLGGQTIFAEPGFRATPGGGGLVLLRLSSCNSSSLKFTDKTTREIIADNKPIKNKTELVAYPNPTTSLTKLSFDLIYKEKNVIVQLYKMDMKKVKEISLSNLMAGKQIVQLDMSNLSAGVYLVILKLQYSQMTTKIVLVK